MVPDNTELRWKKKCGDYCQIFSAPDSMIGSQSEALSKDETDKMSQFSAGGKRDDIANQNISDPIEE